MGTDCYQAFNIFTPMNFSVPSVYFYTYVAFKFFIKLNRLERRKMSPINLKFIDRNHYAASEEFDFPATAKF